MGYAFLEASAKAKIVNMATNAGALIFFLPHGSLLWGVGLVLGFSNMAGGYLGARTAVKQGSRFIRVVFLLVVGALIIKLGFDVWQENFAGGGLGNPRCPALTGRTMQVCPQVGNPIRKHCPSRPGEPLSGWRACLGGTLDRRRVPTTSQQLSTGPFQPKVCPPQRWLNISRTRPNPG
jgi:hypothetical protein